MGTSVNVTRDDKELCAEILERNQFDVRLHDYVKIHWESWKNKYIESISDNISENKLYNVLAAPFYEEGEILYLNLNQINSFDSEQTEELIGLDQC